MAGKKINFTIFFCICLLVILVYEGSLAITTMISNTTNKKNTVVMRAVDDLYKLSFELSKNPSGIINTYIPRYGDVDLKTAETYARYLNILNLEEEEDNYFLFKDGNKKLYVDKTANYIKYKLDEMPIENNILPKLLGDRDALRYAQEFIENNLLAFSYEEAIVEFDGNYYEVVFINTLGNLRNFGFSNSVKLDLYGNVVSMDYYYWNYERLHNARIKSERDAFYELPVYYGEDTEIFIQSCRLVYHYQNGILQPAYLFEGNMNDGKYFEAFVSASVY